MVQRDGRKVLLWLLIFAVGYGGGLVTVGLWPEGHDKPAALAEKVSGGSASEGAPESRTGRLSPSPAAAEQVTSASRHSKVRVSRSITDPQLLRAAVAQYSDAELLRMIAAYTHLAPHDLPEDVAVADVAERLAEIYYGDSFDRAGPLDDPGRVTGMEFDVNKAAANRVADPQELFTVTDKRIYASFETSGYGEREVMVKWSRVDSPEVLIYDKYPIMVGMDHNYVWLEQPQGWEAGKYQVDIYSLADNLSLLARGTYDVD
ncbi:MAG: hypothetical protein KKD73_04465 [Proteobacteria bacterium]|nr:hypothetical protein [Pseudomonadota bacterium]MBU1639625.1 hypothetical protein [Pseudomonadota bacterium]